MIARGDEGHWYAEACVRNAGDIRRRRAQFEAGEFLYFGEGDAYGDACISEATLTRLPTAADLDFALIAFDTVAFPQDVFVLRWPA